MAEFDSLSTPIGSSNDLAELMWADGALLEMQNELWFTKNGMTYKVQKDEDHHKRRTGLPIVMYDDLKSKAGYEVRIPLRMALTRTPRTTTYGTYTYGTTSMLGVEEALVYHDMAIKLGLMKHSTGRDAPDFNDHYSRLDLSEDSEDELKSWLVENREEALLDCIYEKVPYFIQQQLTVSATAHPRVVWAGGVGSQDEFNSSCVFDGNECMRIRSYCRNKKLNPIKYDGKSGFVVLADTFQCADLRMDPVFRELKDAAPRDTKNPIVSGAIGEYQGLLIHEYERIRTLTSGTNFANAGRMCVLGADAIGLVEGSYPRLVQRAETAYEDRWGLAIRQVWGAKRMEFQNVGNTVTTQQSSAEWRAWRRDESWA